MRINPIPLITALLLISFTALSQKDTSHSILLRSGSFTPRKNITTSSINQFNARAGKIDGKSFAVIQFEKIPTAEDRKTLLFAGIELLEYIPHNAYTVSISKSIDTAILERVKARSLIELTPEQKMQPQLAKGIFPSWSTKVAGTIDVWISFPKTLSFETVSRLLQERNFDIISTTFKEYQIIALRIAASRLNELASLPFIEYVQAAPREDQPVNDKSTSNSRANILNSSLPGGRNLQGEGVVVGVGDDSNPLRHVDLSNRIINRAAVTGGAHGLHVMGILGGGGIKEEKFKGYAPRATILSQSFSNVLAYASAYVQDHGMVITTNSYGNIVDDCATFGIYDLYSRILDQQAFALPNLQTVFAVGNSGTYGCSPYPTGFSNVLGGYQTAKNVINVGNTNESGVMTNGSSKGPVRDGRIKPEIAAQGQSVVSIWPVNIYSYNSGSSMAAPAVSGGLALLYQRYRQLHANANPKNGLMKALLCNGANDRGNTGPDYSYGFGWMNLLRSVKMLESNNYVNDSVATAITNTHLITVPANTAQLKVMLYWNDPAAAVLSTQTLVNDLDLEVADPFSTITLPQLLDTIPANVNNTASTGADHINNIEQVVIDNPVSGTYTVSVKGTAVAQNPRQEYFLVFDAIPVSATLTYPIGGEHFKERDSIYISWDAFGNSASNFTLQYSTNDGATWTDINTNVGANLRLLKWFVPSVTTEQAKIKVIHNGTGLESASETFTIIGVPAVSLSAVQCEGYISIDWTAVAGATQYEVMRLRGGEMVSVFTTPDATSLNYTISGLSRDSVYWVSVRAIMNGKSAGRATAISRQPNSGTCAGTVSDNDLKVDAIFAPVSGRQLTSSALSAATIVSVRIKNLDDAAINNFNVKYSVNGAPFVSEPGSSIVAGGTYTHNFAATYDFSSTGSYELRAVVENTSAIDPVVANDTITLIMKQLPNPAITLSVGFDFLDNIEAAGDSSYYSGQVGFQGADRYDFVSSSAYGRVRTFVNSGIAYSGNKAFTLDADRYNAGGTADSLKGTFNLSGHNALTDDIRLDFHYKNHGQSSNATNKVWIRGNDNPAPWIEVYDLFANQEDRGIYKLSSSLEVSDILTANGQAFSSSFQVRWGQRGSIITADNDGGAGYTFDNIRLYQVVDDIQMISIDTPISASCGLNTMVPVKASVRNSANTDINNIPVKFRIDGGSTITETIPTIAGNATIQYEFMAMADLSVPGTHIIEVWVDLPTDTYPQNNLKTDTIINSPVITLFPHLQDFETGNGSWYSEGKNNSWEYGTPASVKINAAANGSKAWKTRLAGNYNDQEKSYLYSPCYNISAMTNPTLSFSIALDLEHCGATFCDGAYIEYSADGKIWTRLGSSGSGTNWYNKSYTGNHLWSIENYTRWHVATIPLPVNLARLRLRFVVESDPFVNKEGIAIDDIHIYDNIMGIYDGVTMSSPVTQNISGGANWIHFTSDGKLVASIQPNNQNMGSTDVQAYINTAIVRNDSNQYYHDRNITIKPTNINLADSATVRFYFLDTESERLIRATGCSGCSKPSTAYQMGVSKYNDLDDAVENSTIADNINGIWSFISRNKVRIAPFDKGYYAEYKVLNFSEFWLKKEAFNKSIPPLVQIINFKASKKANNDVLVEWTTTVEGYVNRFEIEVAKGNADFQMNNFIKIGEVNSRRNATQPKQYEFTDVENNKSGVRYYRLKIINNDGSFLYTEVRPVVFTDELLSQVFPNPSAGLFYLMFQANEGTQFNTAVYDGNGKLVKRFQSLANGFIQKLIIDLQSEQYPSGLYLIKAEAGEQMKTFKVIKQ